MKTGLKYFLVLAIIMGSIISGCKLKRHTDKIDSGKISLGGRWNFSIGDDPQWKYTNYDDNNWETILVPSSWEDQGFNGYDGYAWYRKHFECNSDMYNNDVYLDLGRVDDVEQTYINGHLIGFMGSFPPDFQTAYDAQRKYFIPRKYLNENGDNVIAVRVYDLQLSGGILDGEPGFEIESRGDNLDINLAGIWKFRTGDKSEYSDYDLQDSSWKNITVPANWEYEGYKDYDGFAWYRKEFTVPYRLDGKDLVLMLGKIDDIDQAYINGKLVGHTGEFTSDTPEFNKHNEYLQFRNYKVPANYLKLKGKNVVAVRVYDGFRYGGIYQGPVGIVAQARYTSFWRKYFGDKN